MLPDMFIASSSFLISVMLGTMPPFNNVRKVQVRELQKIRIAVTL